jgi:hypothetical protein
VIGTSTDVPAGTVLRLEQLAPVEIPEQFVTHSLTTDARQLVGKTLTIAVPKGTPIPWGLIQEARTGCAPEAAR